MILLLLQENDEDDPGPEDVRKVGTVAIVRQMAKAGGGGVNIILEGVARVRADVVTRTGTSMRAQVTPLPETYERTIEVDAHVRRIQELIEKALTLTTGLSESSQRRHEYRGSAAPGIRAGHAARHEAGR